MSARVGTLAASPGALGLRRASRALPDLAESAGRSGLGCRGFPQAKTPSAEPGGRSERRRRRNYASAHLPPGVRPLAELGPSELESGIAASQVEQLASLDRLDARGNVVLAGPPGPGKAMAALGPGPPAVDEGHAVALERMESLVKAPDDAEVDRKAGLRLRYLRRCRLVTAGEIGCTPIARTRANRFLGFVSNACERSSMVFTTNKEITQREELVGDRTLTTAMLDRILHHARCLSLRGEPYRLRHPELFATDRL